VGLGEHAQPPLAGLVRAALERGVVEGDGQQQHRIGTIRPGLGHLHRIEHEVLAQQRQVDRGAHRVQELERTPEEPWLGQHRQCGRPRRLEAPGRVHGIEVLPDRSGRGAATLQLADHPQRTRAPGAAKGRVQVPRRVPVTRPCRELVGTTGQRVDTCAGRLENGPQT
jgi:hypothetical protein